METIDHLEAAQKLMISTDGVVAQEITNALSKAKENASRVTYRLERKEWENARNN